MALKRGPKSKAQKAVEALAAPVKNPAVAENTNRMKQRTLSKAADGNVIESSETGGDSRRKTADFIEITVSGSKGQSYTVAVPASYVKVVPKVWEWTQERYRIAELVAEGIPLSQIPDYPDVNIKSRFTIYGWLEHPEFREHVDALILETGWANRRERIAKINRATELVFRKVVDSIDRLDVTDKAIGPLLTFMLQSSKQMAQEKGEFVEETKVTQDTTISGTMGVAAFTQNIETFMDGKTEEERKTLEAEFDKMGDDIIRHLTGGKE